ncbi:hypothetical protein ACFQ1E_06860 [Sphingomonas canadensis]|uniref:SMODS-associating 2TM beta-strand rich effector domain-containing protein n=1 Tax=Sphingomonas canadensis TaxID=1219257 RepID=A0ABW3H3K8_9SPHN|nr:hypothetical protein [Sphingomonas canadensis]MCW3835492.1 hypothetical protein [Sphingomonas canadensis]
MTAGRRIGALVLTITVALMFAALKLVLPLIEGASLPFLGIDFALPLQFLATLLAAAAVYTSAARLMERLLRDWTWLKAKVHGPAFVEGTWIGRFDAADGAKYTVEHIEQSLEGVVVRGWARGADGKPYAEWTSSSAVVDGANGRFGFQYDCDVIAKATRQQGVAAFQFVRARASAPPHEMTGYSADLVDGTRSANHEVKLSDRLTGLDEAFAAARSRFP